MPPTCFSASRSTRDGLQYACKSCNREYRINNRNRILNRHSEWYALNKDYANGQAKKWRESHQDIVADYRRVRYLEHRESIMVSSRAWRGSHPNEAREQKRRWYAANPLLAAETKAAHYLANKPHALDLNRAWRKAHPNQAREIGDRRRARERAAFVENVSRARVIDRDRGLCGICGSTVHEQDMSLDHIVPLSKGGKHSYTNVQLAHRRCNSVKNARLMPIDKEGCVT